MLTHVLFYHSEDYDGSAQKRWYYDTSDGTCKSFEYLGKKGNGNRFLTRQDCETSCQPSQDICQLPKVPTLQGS